MSDYLSQLRPASFRNIVFLMDGDTTSFGRRLTTHIYPGRDEPEHEDLGLDVRQIEIEAIIAGDDFLARADVFQQALLTSGSGLLIHPIDGEITVICKSARRSQETAAAGEIRFSVTFEKTGEPLYPAISTPSSTGLFSTSQKMFGALETEFQERFNLDLKPDFMTQDILARANIYSSEIKRLMSAQSFVDLASAFLPPMWNVSSRDFAGQITSVFGNLSSLVQPSRRAVVGSSVVSPFGGVSIPKLITTLLASTTTSSPAVSSTQSIVQKNAGSLNLILRGATLAAVGQMARYAEYESREQALAVRDRAGAQMLDLRDDLGAAGWDASWQAMSALLASLTADINERVGRLPRTVRLKPNGPRTSLDLAHRLYGDTPDAILSKADDLARRNRVTHPGFMPPTIEVLI